MRVFMGLRPSGVISAVAEGPFSAHPATTSAGFVEPKDRTRQLYNDIASLAVKNLSLFTDRLLGFGSGGLAAISVPSLCCWIV